MPDKVYRIEWWIIEKGKSSATIIWRNNEREVRELLEFLDRMDDRSYTICTYEKGRAITKGDLVRQLDRIA